jgi:hypothetical protein
VDHGKLHYHCGMAKTWDYSAGDTVTYVPFGGGERRVKVTSREADVKGGMPGFVGELIGRKGWDPAAVWGYDEQIVKVSRSV